MKNLKFLLVGLVSTVMMVSCGGGQKENANSENSGSGNTVTTSSDQAAADGKYDPQRGLGKWNESNINVAEFTPEMADAGKKIFDVKCSSCHKLTDEKLVGPGWKGITQKHKPYWIMNFISDPDPMINVDPELQKQLEICMVRMPNQNLTEQDSKDILAFMIKNDSGK